MKVLSTGMAYLVGGNVFFKELESTGETQYSVFMCVRRSKPLQDVGMFGGNVMSNIIPRSKLLDYTLQMRCNVLINYPSMQGENVLLYILKY